MPSKFAAAALDLGFDLNKIALRRFEIYRDMLVDASQQFNLTTIRDSEGIENRHFLESLAFGKVLQQHGLLYDAANVLDIGTGAGFPGLPILIALPELKLAMLESLTKRCMFLKQVVDELGLKSATVLDGRAEDFGRDERYRESFDLVVARAVAPLPVLLEYALPFLRLNGRLAATKGSATLRELEESTAALSELGGEHLETVRFEPPGGVAQSVILIGKSTPTPQRYPRRPGIPTKRPIQ